MSINKDWGLMLLEQYGWDAVADFQQWSGLLSDGVVGPVTVRALLQPRICKAPDRLAVHGQGPCKWPVTSVSWMAQQMPGIPFAQYQADAAWACRQWSEACGINLVYVKDEASIRANIQMTAQSLDGPGGVLGDSQVPCGATPETQLTQRYDVREPWHVGPPPVPRGRISPSTKPIDKSSERHV